MERNRDQTVRTNVLAWIPIIFRKEERSIFVSPCGLLSYQVGFCKIQAVDEVCPNHTLSHCVLSPLFFLAALHSLKPKLLYNAVAIFLTRLRKLDIYKG